jgi:hypothetical protein
MKRSATFNWMCCIDFMNTIFPHYCFTLYSLGEAAGLALGLVMLGSKNAQAIEDMVGYAQETQHEKILRGLAVGIALVMYGRMEEADALIESLCRDKVRSHLSSFHLHPALSASCQHIKNTNIPWKLSLFPSEHLGIFVHKTSCKEDKL